MQDPDHLFANPMFMDRYVGPMCSLVYRSQHCLSLTCDASNLSLVQNFVLIFKALVISLSDSSGTDEELIMRSKRLKCLQVWSKVTCAPMWSHA